MDVFENGVAETGAELGIVMKAHTPLGAGMLTGRLRSPDGLPANEYHRFFPRFQPENFGNNLQLVEKITRLAEERKCMPAQLALAWIKSKSRQPGMPFIVPVAGARSERRIIAMQQMSS
ncbi:hypothetical protein ASPWEDRAFT_747158 [Aspergillus wentii DTO 134E9]|uniref:NADP-dependent oxidoreductase domain-containing protein n=1 Tax=Aspergillus wentii DTO 134E9 TaxID=1073089 RepID=A0A1L9R8Q7_ASPWE|nr:uncharacterized protein ASPWEDRAFT_747158 [Aspergillus wentii DTO 134E9]OJJ31305.1 hypothetical protein ASPWEDRAFT_747158 [Aspergillus wentii DTO 134E9]